MLARAASLPRRAASAETGSARTGVSIASRLPGAGGSAMPCGLVLPAARAKLTSPMAAAGGQARGSVVLVDPIRAAVDDPEIADVGWIERDARRTAARRH